MQCSSQPWVGGFGLGPSESCTCEALRTSQSREKLKHVGAVPESLSDTLNSRYRAGSRGAKKEEVSGPASTPAHGATGMSRLGTYL